MFSSTDDFVSISGNPRHQHRIATGYIPSSFSRIHLQLKQTSSVFWFHFYCSKLSTASNHYRQSIVIVLLIKTLQQKKTLSHRFQPVNDCCHVSFASSVMSSSNWYRSHILTNCSSELIWLRKSQHLVEIIYRIRVTMKTLLAAFEKLLIDFWRRSHRFLCLYACAFKFAVSC